MDSVIDRRISRRSFLGATAAGGAALMVGGIGSIASAAPSAIPDEEAPWFEATVPQLAGADALATADQPPADEGLPAPHPRAQPAPRRGHRDEPQAVGIAAQRDAERRRGKIRGPLHGIPVLLKDNIATDDAMETTAGSLALVGSRVPGDAPLVRRLRKAGAVILGKANLSEWANFRGFIPFDPPFPNGWSARGGFTVNPYVLDWDPCGSSSGSAVAAAANLCAVTVGTETDGSIVCPAGNNLVVGLKPTLGLIAQEGIIPIAHSQDTAGPITRSVTDTAIMLNVMKIAVRAGRRPGAAVRLHGLPAARRPPGRPDRRRPAPVRARLLRAAGDQRRRRAGHRGHGRPRRDDRRPGRHGRHLRLVRRRVHRPALRVQGRRRRLPRRRCVTRRMRTLADLIAFNQAHCTGGDEVLRPGGLRAGRGDERRPERPDLPRGAGGMPAARPGRGHRSGDGRARPRRRRLALVCLRLVGAGGRRLPRRSTSRSA